MAATAHASGDVVVIGGGHNGLAAAAYLARAGLSVTVLEQAEDVGGCLHTVDLPDGAGRLEVGAYEHAGLRGSGVSAELELESRFGLRMIERDELVYSPCDDGSALAFHRDLGRTLEQLGAVVGRDEARRYEDFARFAAAAMRLLYSTESGPPPSLRQLAALSDATLGAAGERLVQTLLAPASVVLRDSFEDERLAGALGHWSAHSQQAPSDPGTGAGALSLAGLHGFPMLRPAGGSRSTIRSLTACVEAHGGAVVRAAPVRRIELSAGRADAVLTGDGHYRARKAVVSSIDARRVFLGLLAPEDVPPALLAEVRRVHSGFRNVAELKVDLVVDGALPPLAAEGYGRAFMVSPNSLRDLERSFDEIALGRPPTRPPFMLGFPSALEEGWAPPGRQAVWVQGFVPWRLADGAWDGSALEAAGDRLWATVKRALRWEARVCERRVTGPPQWEKRHGAAAANPNHVDMSIDQMLSMRPSPSLSRYRTPIPGLYLGGAGSHPGGGITGAPGRNAALAVLADLHGGRRRSGSRSLREQLALGRDALRAIRTLRG